MPRNLPIIRCGKGDDPCPAHSYHSYCPPLEDRFDHWYRELIGYPKRFSPPKPNASYYPLFNKAFVEKNMQGVSEKEYADGGLSCLPDNHFRTAPPEGCRFVALLDIAFTAALYGFCLPALPTDALIIALKERFPEYGYFHFPNCHICRSEIEVYFTKMGLWYQKQDDTYTTTTLRSASPSWTGPRNYSTPWRLSSIVVELVSKYSDHYESSSKKALPVELHIQANYRLAFACATIYLDSCIKAALDANPSTHLAEARVACIAAFTSQAALRYLHPHRTFAPDANHVASHGSGQTGFSPRTSGGNMKAIDNGSQSVYYGHGPSPCGTGSSTLPNRPKKSLRINTGQHEANRPSLYHSESATDVRGCTTQPQGLPVLQTSDHLKPPAQRSSQDLSRSILTLRNNHGSNDRNYEQGGLGWTSGRYVMNSKLGRAEYIPTAKFGSDVGYIQASRGASNKKEMQDAVKDISYGRKREMD